MTEVIPPPPPPPPAPGPAPVAKRRRRRWPWVLLTIVLVLSVPVVAVEVLARSLVPDLIREQVVGALDLPADQDLEVQTEGFLLGQLLAGKLNMVHLSTDEMTLGNLTGSFDITATGLPIDGGPLGSITGTMGIDADQIDALRVTSKLPLDEVRLQDGVITLAGTVRVVTLALPIAIEVEPRVEDGELLLHPTAFELGSTRVDAQGLIEQLGPIAERFTGGFPLCIANRLPRGVELQDMRIEGDIALIDFRIDGAITVDSGLRRPGTCR